MNLVVLDQVFAILKLLPDEKIPAWALSGNFFSITRTPYELSIVCEQSLIPSGLEHDKDWRALKVDAKLDFSLTGILASIASPLADAEISIFAISSFDTDYVLVKSEKLKQAVDVLKQSGQIFDI